METFLSKKLKHYRHMQNMSQTGLAEASGISIRTIQRIEKGESFGSAYTLNNLARALHIDATELVADETVPLEVRSPEKIDPLKLLNLSALAVIFIPFTNIIFPTFIFLNNKADDQIHRQGTKIISFQIIWTVCTLAMMLIVPLILLTYRVVQGAGIPLYVPVYLFCVALNVCCTIWISIRLNHHKSYLSGFPNLL